MNERIHADSGGRVVIDTAAMPWQPSPSPTVHRKRLEHTGPAERGRVTSVVRYDAGATFPPHEHPEGEEILVLDGVFSDERGDHPAGSYLLHPEGYAHAPFSRGGCTIFVKLRQYAGVGRRTIAIDTTRAAFEPTADPGVTRLALHEDPAFPDTMEILRLAPGATVAPRACPRGEEIFVIAGAFADSDGIYPAGVWLRLAPGSASARWSEGGATLYVKRGHLGP